MVIGEVEEVLLDEVEGFAIRLSTGNEWETGGGGGAIEGGGGETSLEAEEELLLSEGAGTLMCLKTFCHMLA